MPGTPMEKEEDAKGDRDTAALRDMEHSENYPISDVERTEHHQRSDDGKMLAKQIVLLFDPWEVLRLGGSHVDETSNEADVRRAYLRLSLLVHPDKLRNVDEATEAFQKLQWAYEAAVCPHDGMRILRSTYVLRELMLHWLPPT